MKMLLGACLAVTVHHHARYRQVAQGYHDLEITNSEDPVLAFVVVCVYRTSTRPSSDLAALLRAITQLEARRTPQKQEGDPCSADR